MLYWFQSQFTIHFPINCRFEVKLMNDSLNFTVTKIGHIHYRVSNPQWNFVDLVNPDHFILAYAESGKAHYLLDGQDVTVEQDQVVFFKIGEPHTCWADPEDPWRYFSLSFDLLFLDEQTRSQITDARTLYAPRNRMRCRNLLFAIYSAWTLQHPGYQLEVRSLLMALLKEIFCSTDEDTLTDIQRVRMQRAISYIHQNLTENCSVAELARIAGFSESYFSKLFRRNEGVSPSEYRKNKRI